MRKRRRSRKKRTRRRQRTGKRRRKRTRRRRRKRTRKRQRGRRRQRMRGGAGDGVLVEVQEPVGPVARRDVDLILQEQAEEVQDSKIKTEALQRACVGCGAYMGRGPLTTGGLDKDSAVVYEVTEPFQIFRVFESTSNHEPGPWWSFDVPTSTIDEWRKENGVCKVWNPHPDRLKSAYLKKGAIIVVGPGAQAKCDDKLTYAASDINQIYVRTPKTSLKNRKTIAVANPSFNWTGTNTRSRTWQKPSDYAHPQAVAATGN